MVSQRGSIEVLCCFQNFCRVLGVLLAEVQSWIREQTPPRSRHPPEQTPPPPRADTPCEQTPTPLGADTNPLGADTPPGADIPPGSRHPPGADTPQGRPPLGSRLQQTVYEWPVRILLECILVCKFYFVKLV